MIRVDRDDFEEWRANPITQRLMTALAKESERIKELWSEISLEGGRIDPAELAEYRTRRRVYREITEMSADRLEEIINEQG